MRKVPSEFMAGDMVVSMATEIQGCYSVLGMRYDDCTWVRKWVAKLSYTVICFQRAF